MASKVGSGVMYALLGTQALFGVAAVVCVALKAPSGIEQSRADAQVVASAQAQSVLR